MGTIECVDNVFRIRIESSDKVRQEVTGIMSSHQEIMNYICSSAKQMADFIQNDTSDTQTLRTPSRRTSKRKRSSVAIKSSTTTKKAVPLAMKTRDPTLTTPKRLSKRSRRSTIKLDTTVDEMDVQRVDSPVHQLNTYVVPEVIDCEQNVGQNDSKPVEKQPIIEDTDELKDNEEKPSDHMITASELMSELSLKTHGIKDDNESENEWMTDDEDGQQRMETEKFYDAIPAEVRKQNDLSVNKTLTTTSAAKEIRKKSQYFTPQSTQRSTRAQTRMLSRIADSSQKTPQTASRLLSSKPSTASDSSSVRSCSRIQRKVADNKALTDSAMKRRSEAEEQRKQRLLASQEKEKRAIEKRRILIQQTVNEKKQKSQEKANRAAELRELQKRRDTEKLRKEMEKREEWERKHEEEKREQMRKRQEEMAQKSREIERRKQLQELKESEAKMKKAWDLNKKEEMDRERLREQDRMLTLIQQHNNSLQQKAFANSFAKKFESNLPLIPKVVINKLSPQEMEPHLKTTTTEVAVELQTEEVAKTDVQLKERTFVVSKDDVKDTSSYDMTPPPRERNYDNYDISTLQSDDDTDDEQQPRKRIPNWARGQVFINQLHKQFAKTRKVVYKEVESTFGSGDEVLKTFETDFQLMFPKKPLHPKYQKRTSSAVWDSPPIPDTYNDFSIN